MKKKLLAVLLSLVSVFALCAFAACDNGTNDSDDDSAAPKGNVVLNVESVIFTANSEVIELTESTSLKDYLDALARCGELVFAGSDGDYGFMIESVYGRAAEGNAFWAVYTDLVTLEGDDAVYSNADWGTFTIGNTLLNSAAYGVSNLPCVEGYTYALVYTTF